jgi:hypothetical protein
MAAVASVPAVARAQSLVTVAQAEEARRKTVKQPAKVYTNDNLRPSNDPPSTSSATRPAAPSTSGAAGAAAAAAAPAPVASGSTKDEKYWKDRITLARETLAHDKVLAEAVQSRINALTTDFVNTSDPAQRAVVDGNRKAALAELDRLNKDADKQTKTVSDIQEEARKAGVPSGWLR